MANPNPNHHDITISVDANGNFTYSPSDLRAAPNDTVSFKTAPAGLKFEVMFKHRTPGDRTHIRDTNPQDRGGGHLQCRNDPGHYKYGAAIYDPVTNQVFIDAGCGHIGVGN